jgi:acid phosphatase
MRKLLFILPLIFLISCDEDTADATSPAGSADPVSPVTPGLPMPDHVIFIWFENKDFTQIIGSPEAPYINSLRAQGTTFSNFHALGHPSYPEYIRFFSGTDNNKHDDDCIDGLPYSNPNLYTQLATKGKTFAWYSEDLPETGSTVCYSGDYVERHNPTQCFSNVSMKNNKRWADFPDDYSQLEHVVCVSPNVQNDMHDGSIRQGDSWLQRNCSQLISWCKDHNSVLVVYFDENSNVPGNRIPVVAVGQPVKTNYTDSTHYDHYNWTRTLLSMYGAAPIANSGSREDIMGCWKNE